MFDITKEDHLNIELAEAVGVTHLAVSYPQVSDQLELIKHSSVGSSFHSRISTAH